MENKKVINTLCVARMSFGVSARVLSFSAGVGVSVVAYGSLRDSLFAQQRAIHMRLSEASSAGSLNATLEGGGASPSRVKILAELDSERRSLFKQMGDTWNGAVLSAHSVLTGEPSR